MIFAKDKKVSPKDNKGENATIGKRKINGGGTAKGKKRSKTEEAGEPSVNAKDQQNNSKGGCSINIRGKRGVNTRGGKKGIASHHG